MNIKKGLYYIPELMIWLGWSILVPGLFPSAGVPWWGQFLWGVFLVCLFGLVQESGRIQLMWQGTLLLSILAMIFLQIPLRRSMGNLLNDLQAVWISHSGKVALGYAAADQGIIVLLLLGVLIQLILSVVKQTQWKWLLGVIYLPIAFAIACGYPVNGLGLMILLISLFLYWGPKNEIGIGLTALALTACFGFGIAWGLRSFDIAQITQVMDKKIHEMKYDADSNSMPEGNLATAGEWNKSDAQALSITMEKPQKAYIKGHVYNAYQGDSWSASDVADPREDADLFYWLHQQGFYGQEQISQLQSLTGRMDLSLMTIDNVSACKEVGYIPYGYVDSSQLLADVIGDRLVTPDVTSYMVSTGGLAQWYLAQDILVKRQKQEEYQSYLEQEQAYRKYVYAHDLQLTKEAAEELESLLGVPDPSLTMADIQKNIYDFLSAMLTYEEDPDAMGAGEDFLTYVIEDSGEGYSVHYATIATLLFRYYGIPARYCEGYFLSREEVASVPAGEPYFLTEAHAHAWTEFYLDGVGFVPFEVTPGYIDPEDLEDGTGADQAENQFAGKQTKSKDLEKPDVEPDEEEDTSIPLGAWIIMGLLLFALAALGLYCYGKRRKLKLFLASILSMEPKEQITMEYAYAQRIKDASDVKKKDKKAIDDGISSDMHKKAELLNQEARFSSHPMTSEQAAFMATYRRQVLDSCKKKWRFLEKLKLKYLKGLY